MNAFLRPRSLVVVLLTLLALATALPARARHSWSRYHWARNTNPFTLKLGDNVDSNWDSHLMTASSHNTLNDWSDSAVLDTIIVPGRSIDPNQCNPTSGRVEVCNYDYGDNGWLGIAQIWVAIDGHIYQGATKMNDYYFNQPFYNNDPWRLLVMCQEVGHTFGLGHQDETFNNTNLGSCMDYTNDPDGGAGGASETDPSNEYPNQHDYDQLQKIYGKHGDNWSSIDASASGVSAHVPQGQLNSAAEWGRLVKGAHGQGVSIYERELPSGEKMITFVTWVDGHDGAHH